MAKKNYWELLRDPRWQRKRLEIMERAEFSCEDCGTVAATLNVHHSFYEKGLAPWEYPDESLHCLCERCHKKAQLVMTHLHRAIGRLSLSQIDELLGVACGIAMANDDAIKANIPQNYEALHGFVSGFVSVRGPIERQIRDIVFRFIDQFNQGNENGISHSEVVRLCFPEPSTEATSQPEEVAPYEMEVWC